MSPHGELRGRRVNLIKTDWRSVGAVTLPIGWSNEYDIGNGEKFIEPCPALLLQERRGQTRCVFATYADGCLEAACDNPLYHDSTPPYPSVKPPRRTGPPPTVKNAKRVESTSKPPIPQMVINKANRPDFTKMEPVRNGVNRGDFSSPFFFTGGRLDGQTAPSGYQPFVVSESGSPPEGDRLPDLYYLLFRQNKNEYRYIHSTLLPSEFVVFPAR